MPFLFEPCLVALRLDGSGPPRSIGSGSDCNIHGSAKISAGFSQRLARRTEKYIETVEAGSGHERHRCRPALDDARCGAGFNLFTDAPATVNGRPVPAVQGAWRSRGYGYGHTVTDEGPKLFHVAGDFCHADPRPEPDPDKLFVFYQFLDRDTVAFSGEVGQTR